MNADQARALFLEHCQPGDRGTLERYGEEAAVAAILAATQPATLQEGEDDLLADANSWYSDAQLAEMSELQQDAFAPGGPLSGKEVRRG